MVTVYTVSFFCHGCGLENSFTFQCQDDYFTAASKATTISCPSGCNPQKASFELTGLNEVGWETAVDSAGAVFH